MSHLWWRGSRSVRVRGGRLRDTVRRGLRLQLLLQLQLLPNNKRKLGIKGMKKIHQYLAVGLSDIILHMTYEHDLNYIFYNAPTH